MISLSTMVKFLALFWAITISMYGHGEGAEVAVKQRSITIKYLQFGVIYSTGRWEQNLPDLTPEKRDKMCKEAKEFASLDGENPVADAQLHFTFVTKDETHAPRITLIKCSTLPVSYLRTEPPYSNFEILLEENKFITDESYNLKAESIQTNPRLCADVVRERPEYNKLSGTELAEVVKNECQANFLPKTTNEERLLLCSAAKKSASNWPTLQTDQIDEAQMFYVKRRPDNELEKVAGISCASHPPMLVVFVSPKVARVLVTDPEGQLETKVLKN